MNKLAFLFVTLSFFLQLYGQTKEKILESEYYSILNSYFSKNDNPIALSKFSYTKNWSEYVKNIKSWYFEKALNLKALDEINNLTQAEESLFKNEIDSLTNLYKTLTRIPTDSVFTEQDFKHLIEQAKKSKKITWKQKYLSKATVSSEKKAYVKMSAPTFSVDKTKALVYVEFSNNGNLFISLLMITNGLWKASLWLGEATKTIYVT